MLQELLMKLPLSNKPNHTLIIYYLTLLMETNPL